MENHISENIMVKRILKEYWSSCEGAVWSLKNYFSYLFYFLIVGVPQMMAPLWK